jgi:hypothetical protein
MKSKVFISCGQSAQIEKDLAKKIKDWFISNDFNAYVAITTQSIQDVNSGIIEELKSSDYYVFIDFKREQIGDNIYRGSLFTNQELAIAYLLDFEKVAFIRHKDIKLEGISQYMLSNALTYENENEIFDKLTNYIKESQWTTQYTRHLHIKELNFPGPFTYTDHRGQRQCHILTLSIVNKRHDIAAYNTVARLEKIESEKETKNSPDMNYLKVTGKGGYNQIIWPTGEGAIDLLNVTYNDPEKIYLNSSSDIHPISPIIYKAGQYILHYSILAQDFPLLKFKLQISVSADIKKFGYKIIE